MNQAPSPRAAMALASGFGLGYLPIAPGTWGSLGGVVLFAAAISGLPQIGPDWNPGTPRFWGLMIALNLVIAAAGVWSATQVARHLKKSDPGVVVIDEISGQLIAYLPLLSLDWRWLLAGFLLFRALDIWKPFPARQLEALLDGWGIMADDWMAGAYAALALLTVRWLLP